jgi:DNA-binding NarL/FixJ family response regulator
VTNDSILTLIVEDDPSWQEILTDILTDFGLQIDICDNLEDAVEHLRSTLYRLAIIDLSLQGDDHSNQDGLAVLKAVQRHAPGCVSVMLTGYASVELAVAVIQEYGAMTCLRKETFRRSEFREVVRQALTASNAKRELADKKVADKASDPSVSPDQSDSAGVLTGLALVVEDDAGWRSLLSELLQDAGYRVHESTSYGEALGLLKRKHYQVTVVDISLASSVQPNHNEDGLRLLKTTRQAGIPTIIVSGSADPDLIDRAYSEHNIYAYLEKQSFERRTFLENVDQIVSLTALPQSLTDREKEVLSLVAQGLSNKEIATKLVISTNTVKRHLKSIFTKLNVNSRAAASAHAIRMGLGSQLQEE